MNFLLPQHKELLWQMAAAEVEFLLIGGYAVIYHGYVRATGDMDIWLKPDNSNRNKLISILKNQNISDEDIDYIKNIDFEKMQAFSMGEMPERIDFLTKLDGLEFNEAYKNSIALPLKDRMVHVLKLTDLILNKMTSGRLKDRADIEELQKISGSKNNQ